MHVWRSGGWPCRDAIEIDLIAAAWVSLALADSGHETLRQTETGIQLLAASRQRNQRAASAHDRLAARVAQQLMEAGRIVWRELSLRAQVSTPDEPPVSSWRIARPDVFSVRNTSVEAYLQPACCPTFGMRPNAPRTSGCAASVFTCFRQEWPSLRRSLKPSA